MSGGELVLFVDGGEESREAEGLLKRAGLSFRRVSVDRRLRGWLLVELGVARLPALVAGGAVLVGLERIRSVAQGAPGFWSALKPLR